MKAGCYTALITPFKGDEVDWAGLDRLVDFQIQNGVTGILAVGTTGESPVLNWQEHNEVTEKIAAKARDTDRIHRVIRRLRRRDRQRRQDLVSLRDGERRAA